MLLGAWTGSWKRFPEPAKASRGCRRHRLRERPLERRDPGDLDLAFLWAEEVGAEERWRRANRIAAEVEHRLVAVRT